MALPISGSSENDMPARSGAVVVVQESSNPLNSTVTKCRYSFMCVPPFALITAALSLLKRSLYKYVFQTGQLPACTKGNVLLSHINPGLNSH
jgi:hypothetical protein